MTGVYAGNAVGLVSRSSRPCLNRKRDLRVTHGRDGAENMPSVHLAPIRAIPPLRRGWFIRWVGATQPGLTLATLYASLPGCVARLLALLAQIRANQRGG
ncbi:MAG: hypothetical protein H6668_00240 [Ardenticatenaceae bacterium]|nr:hypothetical protein [Ardenticatenaceae bacterium]